MTFGANNAQNQQQVQNIGYQPKDLLGTANNVQLQQKLQPETEEIKEPQEKNEGTQTYQPRDLLADTRETAPTPGGEDIPAWRKYGLLGLAERGYQEIPTPGVAARRIETIPLGAAKEARRISEAIPKGIGKYGLYGLLGKAYEELPAGVRELPERFPRAAKLGKTATDIATITGAAAVSGAGAGALVGPEAGAIAARAIPALGRVTGVGGITALTAPPGERMAGALTGVAAGLGGEVAGAALGAVPTGISKLGSFLAKEEKPLITDPEALREAAARVKQAKEVGVTGLPAGAITRIPEIQAREELMMKGGPTEVAAPLQMAAQQVDKQINNTAQKMINSLGGETKTSMAIGEDVQNVLRGTTDKALKTVGNLYDHASNAPGGNVFLPRNRIVDKFNEINDDFIDVKFSPRVKRIMQELAAPQATFNVKDANTLNQALNKSYRSATTSADRTAIGLMKYEVYNTIDDTFAGQVNPAAELFKIARNARKNLGDVMDQKDVVQAIVRKKSKFTDYIAPEDVAKKIFSSTNSVSNLNKIENALNFDLDPMGRKISNPQGQQVWNNLRRFKFNQFINDSTNIINGRPVLSYFKLIRNYKKVGKPAMDKILGDKVLSTNLDKLMNVMEFWQNKAPGTINYSNTANAINRMANKLTGLMTARIPFIGGMMNTFRSMVEHAQDKEWVMKNLKLAQMLRKNPDLADYIRPQETTPALTNSLAQNLTRNAANVMPMMGQTERTEERTEGGG